MKMIKFLLLGLPVFLATQMGFAQAKPLDAGSEINTLRTEIQKLGKSLQEKEAKLAKAQKDVDFLVYQNKILENKLDSVGEELKGINLSLEKTIEEVNLSLGTKIDATSVRVSENKASTDKSFHSVVVYGSSGLLIALIITFIIFFILRKRIGQGVVDLTAVKEANKKLAEQSVALDNRLAEILERQLKTDENIQHISSKTEETDHSLVLSIANEMMRIEQNLSFMDPKTKGVSQLKNRATAISALLSSKGYDVPKLVNTEYKEGMNYEAVMEEDEDLEPGIMIIKRVTQPCVMFHGKMIQAAKVVVAYNPAETEQG